MHVLGSFMIYFMTYGLIPFDVFFYLPDKVLTSYGPCILTYTALFHARIIPHSSGVCSWKISLYPCSIRFFLSPSDNYSRPRWNSMKWFPSEIVCHFFIPGVTPTQVCVIIVSQMKPLWQSICQSRATMSKNSKFSPGD